jgi:hypothetical protein
MYFVLFHSFVYAIAIISYEGTCAQWRLNGLMEERDKALSSPKVKGLKLMYYHTDVSSPGMVHSKGSRTLLLCVLNDIGCLGLCRLSALARRTGRLLRGTRSAPRGTKRINSSRNG